MPGTASRANLVGSSPLSSQQGDTVLPGFASVPLLLHDSCFILMRATRQCDADTFSSWPLLSVFNPLIGSARHSRSCTGTQEAYDICAPVSEGLDVFCGCMPTACPLPSRSCLLRKKAPAAPMSIPMFDCRPLTLLHRGSHRAGSVGAIPQQGTDDRAQQQFPHQRRQQLPCWLLCDPGIQEAGTVAVETQVVT